MGTTMRRALGWAGLVIGLCGPARCEEQQAYVAGGVAAGTHGPGGTASLNVVNGRMLWTLRLARFEEFVIFGPTPVETSTDIALMAGRVSRGRRSSQSAAVGLGFAQCVRRGRELSPGIWFVGPQHERLERSAPGLAFEAQATFHGSVAGIGLGVLGNLNTAGSFMGLALNVRLGKLR